VIDIFVFYQPSSYDIITHKGELVLELLFC